MQQLFIDNQLNDEYEETGFVRVPFVSENVLYQLRQLYTEYCPEGRHENGQVFYSMFVNSAEQNLKLKKSIAVLLEESYQRTFVNYQSFAEMFLAKYPDNEPLVLHQDWSYTHESVAPSATLWLPLQKTSQRNGTLFLIPGSHKFFKTYRSGSMPSARIRMDESLQKFCTTIEVDPGEAVFFHQAIFHGSHPNLSQEPRLVAASVITTRQTPLTYFHRSNISGTVKTYKLTDDSFFNNLHLLTQGKIYEGAESINDFPYSPITIDSRALMKKI